MCVGSRGETSLSINMSIVGVLVKAEHKVWLVGLRVRLAPRPETTTQDYGPPKLRG